MEQNITIPVELYHTLRTAAENNIELKQTMNLTFLSNQNGGYFLSVVTNDGQTADDVHVIRIPKLQYLQMKKRGIAEITKKVFEDAENV